MKKTIPSLTKLVIILIFNLHMGFGQVSDLIISEYAEGSSNNKYIEIYNGTGSSVDLSDYEVWKIANGGSWAESTLSLSGTLADGAVYIVSHASADQTILDVGDVTWSQANWNGDDAVGIAKDSGSGTFVLLDAIGEEGSDPGSGWDVAGTSNATANHTLVRKPTVCGPQTNWTTSAGTNTDDSEWTVYASNTWDHIDSHTASCAGSVDDPTSFSASVQSTSQIDLSWTDNSSSDNVLLAWNSSSTFGTPTDGSTYTAGGSISGGGTVLQYSATDSYSHTSLSSNTAYYYKAWSCDGSTYSSGTATDATTLKVEPTYHPTSFSASASYQSIQITWTDAATGSQAPDGYLILGETDATITDPSDGTAVSDDTEAAGNAVAKNVTHGSGGSYNFSSLTAGTTWYFEIFSYTNSGSSIDYKTDGTIPTANATTGVTPVFVINEIHADPDATNGDANGDGSVSTQNDEFVEIVNRSGTSLDISNWVIADGYGDRHTVPNGTTIGDGVALVVFGGGTPTNISGIAQTASSGGLELNNSGDVVTLKDDAGGTIVTYTYGSEAGDDQSIARNPDYTGDFVKHLTISGNAVRFSPGKTNASDVSLPVDLSYFNANSTRSDEITLSWVTESEVENLGFVVERRNVNTESLWIEIASYISHPELQGQGSVTHRTEYTFIDNTVEAEHTYDYRLADVSFDGVKKYHQLYVLNVSPDSHPTTSHPTKFRLHQNYPNPFNPATTIRYGLPEMSNVILTVYDIQGREITTLLSSNQAAGDHEVIWNGRTSTDESVQTGLYFVRIEAGNFSNVIKMMYLK